MNSPSAFSTFYPTSSSTLAQHSCVRLLWLPLSSCLKMAGEHARNLSTSSSLPPLSQQSVANSFSRGGGSIGFAAHSPRDAEDELVSGFELRFRHACEHTPPIPMSHFRECFAATSSSSATTSSGGGRSAPSPITAGVSLSLPPHYREDGWLRFLVGDDVGASQWENIEMHRVIHGVVVVVNTNCTLSVSLEQVLSVVKTVFGAQYRDKVCRCYIVTDSSAPLSPTQAHVRQLITSLPPRTFVVVETARPVAETVQHAMEDIGRNVVFSLNAMLNQFDVAMATLAAKGVKGKADLTSLRTPLDVLAVNGGAAALLAGATSLEATKVNLLVSRFAKKRADILVQLGATDLALKAYGETQFASNADALWCSAVLESIASARYQQWHERLVPQLPELSAALVALQSDDTDWTEAGALEARLALLESVTSVLCGDVQRTLSFLKVGPCVPASMRQRLGKEVDEALTVKAAQLTEYVTRARASIAAGSNELESDPYAYRVGTDLKLCVEEMLRLGLNELDVYLNESLRQQRHATTPSNKKALQDRDLETRLKSVSLLVDRGATNAFLNELSDVRLRFSAVYGDVVQKALRFFTFLCVRARCRRKAIAFLVEIAHNNRKDKLYAATIQSLVRACFLSGIALGSIPELNAAVLVDSLCRLYIVVTNCAGASGGFLSHAATVGVGGGTTLPLPSDTHSGSNNSNTSISNNSTGPNVGGAERHARENGSATTALIKQANAGEAGFTIFGGDDLHPEQGTSKHNELLLTAKTMQRHIPLLLELLDVLHEADCRGSVRCQLATLLLFRYPTYLDRSTTQLLIDIARAEALRLEPHVRPATAALPFLAAWEALPLPPNLAPKTVSVGGPFFTFIDTQRLKLTILSLNGRKLNSRVVWTVGDAGTVMVSLYNPYQWSIKILSLSLQSRSCADLDEQNNLPSADTESHTTGPLAPTCYVLSNVVLKPFTKSRVMMQVLPKMEGFLRIEGVEMRLEHLKGATLPVQGRLPEPMGIPVLRQLPLVSCTVSVSELEIFSGQCIDLTVRVVNCGQLPIEHILLTAHGEACQLEDCEGCKERASSSDVTVVLNKTALEAASRVPLRPGDVVTIPVHLQAPPSIDAMGSHFVIFRVDCSLPHEKPTMPPNVPSAVPVFGVIPRRVTETRMRVFHAPTLAVTTVRLTKDKRFVDVRLANRSERYSVELALSALPFSDIPDALLVAGADYVVPPFDISRVSDHGKLQGGFLYPVRWAVREIPQCTGTLVLDLSLVAEEVVCTEPLNEVLVTLDFEVPTSAAATDTASRYLTTRHWESHGLPLGALTQQRLHHINGSDNRKSRRQRRKTRDRKGRTSLSASSRRSSHSSTSFASSSASFQSPSSRNSSRDSSSITEAAKPKGEGHHSICRHGDEAGMSAEVVAAIKPGRGRQEELNAKQAHTLTTTAAPPAGSRTASDTAGGQVAFVGLNALPIIVPAVTPIQLRMQAWADWRRAVPLRFSVSMTNHLDVGVLSGPVECVATVGERGRCVCEQRFELLAFKTGEHDITITVKDSAEREITHVVRFVVQHDR